jgi:phosphoribosylaminoimidazole carboxylase (NCAIR synthetase)
MSKGNAVTSAVATPEIGDVDVAAKSVRATLYAMDVEGTALGAQASVTSTPENNDAVDVAALSARATSDDGNMSKGNAVTSAVATPEIGDVDVAAKSVRASTAFCCPQAGYFQTRG